MTKTESLKNLVKISNKIGENLGFIQGGGGNTSVKFGPRSMAVKSSGSLLSDMTLGNGYCVVDYRSINDYLNNPDDNEDEFVLKIRNQIKYLLSPKHIPSKMIQVQDIPKTKNGKIVELTVKKIMNNEAVLNLNSLVNPECLLEYKKIAAELN